MKNQEAVGIGIINDQTKGMHMSPHTHPPCERLLFLH